MSELKLRQPVIHVPSFKEYKISGSELGRKVRDLGLEIPMGRLDNWYYHSDMEGWGSILRHLVFKSSLYKTDRFDCEDYALKAMLLCAELYGLNTLRLTVGDMPQGRHGWDIFYYGDGFMLFEPNEGFPFSGSAFEIGEYGYQPDKVLL